MKIQKLEQKVMIRIALTGSVEGLQNLN